MLGSGSGLTPNQYGHVRERSGARVRALRIWDSHDANKVGAFSALGGTIPCRGPAEKKTRRQDPGLA